MGIEVRKKRREWLGLEQQLRVLGMPRSQRRKILRAMANEAKKDATRNARNQRTVSGTSMKPSRERGKKKMFRKLYRANRMQIRTLGDDEALVQHKSGVIGTTAMRHHKGFTERWNAAKARARYGATNYSAPCTIAQAKALKREGFHRRVVRQRGKGGAIHKKASLRWIRENMTLGQAGMILRMMRTKKREGKQSWDTTIPARPVLGATPETARAYMTELAETVLRKMDAKK